MLRKFRLHRLPLQVYRPRRQRGFSLIEFLVASAIGMIVLMAAGSTYFTTRQLNQVASARLSAQQDLRNAANLIVRDARQAGTFGCANLGSSTVTATTPYAATHLLGMREQASAAGAQNTHGLRIADGGDFVRNAGVSGFTAGSKALIFVYGDGYAAIRGITPDTLPTTGTVNATAMQLDVAADDAVGQVMAYQGNAAAPLVLSSCNRVVVLARGSGYTRMDKASIGLTPAQTISSLNPALLQPGQLGISKLAASAYIIGTFDAMAAQPGLYHFTLTADGSWSGPQLLVANIASDQGMSIQFGYVYTANCNDGAGQANEHFQFRDTTTDIGENYSRLPALLRVRLNVSNTDAQVAAMGKVQEYVIDAAVRGGNVCANRSLGQ